MSRFTWGMLVVLLCVAACSYTAPAGFDGASSELNRTVVLATMDELIPEGKNAIWCASFEASWKELIEMKAKEAEARPERDGYLFRLGVYDTVSVPDTVFRIAHHFAELEGRTPANAKLENLPLVAALQVVQFRLTRSGAELRSEAAKRYLSASVPQDYIFDGPFLIYMKKRGADRPYFAMWVDNAELLQPWKE
jgi:hypothetical protein